MDSSQAEHLGQSIQAIRPLQIGAVPLIYPILSGLDVRQTVNDHHQRWWLALLHLEGAMVLT